MGCTDLGQEPLPQPAPGSSGPDPQPIPRPTQGALVVPGDRRGMSALNYCSKSCLCPEVSVGREQGRSPLSSDPTLCPSRLGASTLREPDPESLFANEGPHGPGQAATSSRAGWAQRIWHPARDCPLSHPASFSLQGTAEPWVPPGHSRPGVERWAFSEHLLCVGRGARLLPSVSPRASRPWEEMVLICSRKRGEVDLEQLRRGRAAPVPRWASEPTLPPAPPGPSAGSGPRPCCLQLCLPPPPFHVLSHLFAASCASYNFSFLSPQGLSFASQGSSAPFWSGTAALGAWGGRPAASCLAGLARGCPLAHSPCLKVSTAACSLVPAGVEGSGPGKEVTRRAGGAAAGT